MSQTGHIDHPSIPPSSLLSSLASHASEQSYDDCAMLAMERKLNFQSACTLKALSPLMQVIAFEQLKGMQDTEAAKLCRELVQVCRKHASEVCIALDLSEDSVSWGRSYFAGAIAAQISAIWPRSGRAALDINWAVSLSEIASPLLLESIPPTWKNTEQGVSITATVMNAIQSLMQEYDTFSLFHRDRLAIQDEFATLLLDEAVYQTEIVTEKHLLSDDSRCSLTQSLIKNGGAILATLWNSQARNAVDLYQNKATEEQRSYFEKNGFPLEDIKESFVSQMENLSALSVKSMDTFASKQALSATQEQSPG